jgi:SAM-dependent methyltransferase
VKVIEGDARDMPFEDGAFDLIVSSSTLEHIPDFWRACDEIKRVLAPDGLVIINVPGYGETAFGKRFRRLGFRLRLPDIFKRSTPTFSVHDAPHDYYRFSRYTFEDVILKDLIEVEIWPVLCPPRIFGRGRKPG